MNPASKRRKCEKLLELPCGWEGCSQTHPGDWALNTHIFEHLEAYLNKDNDDNLKDGYKCAWNDCTFVCDCTEEFQRHMYYHGYYTGLIVQGTHECETHPEIPGCNAPERDGDIVPDLKTNFQCRWTDCNRTFLSIVEFQDHIVQHASFEYEIQKSPDDERPKTHCKWNFCQKQLENKYRLIEHISTHSNKKFVACFRCGELFRTKTTLFDHLRRQPDNNTHKYQCAQCLKYFATEKLLRGHLIKHVNCYKCTMCDMTCSSSSALATHIRYRHLKDKPYQCTQCDTRCVRESDLAKHVRIVHSKEGHHCEHPGCQFSVRTYTQMRRHILEVHNNSPIIYVCHCCEKFLKSGKSLSAHLIKKHDFQLPSGHKRFTYRQDENGFYRLETMRIESLEVTQQILESNETPNTTPTTDVIEDSGSYAIISLPTSENMGNYEARVIVSSDNSRTTTSATTATESTEERSIGEKTPQHTGEVVISLPDLN